MTEISALERKLDYHFNQPELLRQSLSHRSLGVPNNERLEYLGDSVLGFFIARSLYRQFPHLKEGDLTKMRARLVCKSTLASLARELDLSGHLKMGSGELKSGGCNKDSILSDAFEAIIGAVYLDGGLKPVNRFLKKMYRQKLAEIQPVNLVDNKTQLQEILQKSDRALPVYTVVSQTGEAHELTFEVSCHLPGMDKTYKATGRSRKSAEQKAARLAFDAIKNNG